MKALKYLLYALGAVIVLVVALLAIVAATFDPNAYKPQIEQQVKAKTGRTLTIQGEIGLKLFPKIGAELRGISLSERDGTAEFAGVSEAQVYLALLPLLSREVVVDTVRVDGLRANLIRYKDGHTNFDDLTAGRESAAPLAPQPQPTQPAQPIRLDVSGVRVTNSRVSWKDQTTGNDLTVELVSLKTGRIAEKTPSKVELEAKVKGVKPAVELALETAGTLTFDLAGQQFSFKGLDAKLSGSAMEFKDLALTLQGDIDALGEAKRVAVSGLKLDGKASRGKDTYNVKLSAPAIESTPDTLAIEGLTAGATGSVGGMQLTESNLKAPTIRVSMAQNRILVEGLALTAAARTGEDKLDVNLSAPKLDVTSESASGESATLTAKLSGAQRAADITVKLSGVEGSAKALKIAALTMDVDAKQQDNAVKGHLSTPIAANLEAKVFELPKLAASFKVTSPAIPQKTVEVPLTGLVRADLGKERVFADLVAKFDESNIQAKGGITRFAKPAYDFDVAIDKLNIDRYLPAKKAEPTEPAKPAEPAGPEQPIDLSPLKPLDVDGKLKVGQLQVKNIKAASVRVDVRAKDGKVRIEPLLANLYEGSTKGAATIDANTNRFAVKQTMTGVAIGPLLRDAAQKDILEGKGNVALDVTTQGNLVSAMKRGLNGTAQLALRDGAVKGIDLAGAVRTAKSKFGGKDAEGAAARNEKTDFSELTASFVIRNGVAHNDDLSLKSPFLRVTGAGDVNIGEDTLDYLVKTAIVGTMAGQGGRELAELKGFTVPVRLSGPYTALKYKVELSQMFGGKEQFEAVKGTAKEAARQKLQELLGGGAKEGETQSGSQAQPAAPTKKPEEELKEKLKGLFR